MAFPQIGRGKMGQRDCDTDRSATPLTVSTTGDQEAPVPAAMRLLERGEASPQEASKSATVKASMRA